MVTGIVALVPAATAFKASVASALTFLGAIIAAFKAAASGVAPAATVTSEIVGA
ncbi:Uncharacterised protein [Streptococcus pneumoniae]|nr:Uncharacterised protein [Streptococcus pneumoniae]SSS47415.1 Uncharacterised protein [Acinetobacter baumannii]